MQSLGLSSWKNIFVILFHEWWIYLQVIVTSCLAVSLLVLINWIWSSNCQLSYCKSAANLYHCAQKVCLYVVTMLSIKENITTQYVTILKTGVTVTLKSWQIFRIYKIIQRQDFSLTPLFLHKKRFLACKIVKNIHDINWINTWLSSSNWI